MKTMIVRLFAGLFAAATLLFAGCASVTSKTMVTQFPNGTYQNTTDYHSTSVSPFVFVCVGDPPAAQPIYQQRTTRVRRPDFDPDAVYMSDPYMSYDATSMAQERAQYNDTRRLYGFPPEHRHGTRRHG
jgi:major membrane immunogen (membrane-anchored lipoprotein)